MDSKQLVVNDVVAAIGGDIEVKFIALKSEAMAFSKCETKEQFSEIKAVHTKVKDARLALKARGEEVRAPAVEFQKNVIKYVDEKTAFIAPAESHLKALLDVFEATERKRIDDAKNAKIERAKRLKSIADSFIVVAMFDDTALSIGAKIDTLKAVNVTELDLAEYESVAMANIAASIYGLENALEILKKREEQEAAAAEQMRLARERAEAEKIIAKHSAIAQSFVVYASFGDTSESLKVKINELLTVDVATLDIGEYADIAHKNIMKSISVLTDAKIECQKQEDLAKAKAEAEAEAEAERRAAEARQKELDRIAAEELAKAKAEAEAAKAQLEEIARQERIKRDEEVREAARLAAEKVKAEAEELARIEKEAAEKAALEASEYEKVRREENKSDAEALGSYACKAVELLSRIIPKHERNRTHFDYLSLQIEKAAKKSIYEMVGE